jgi:Spy/CpxP family protein refolding chaperone
MKNSLQVLAPLLALTFTGFAAHAQDNADPRGGRGGFEEFRQRMNERLKNSLKLSDEEWNAILPLVEKVQSKQRDVMSARFGGGRTRGGDSSAASSEWASRPGAAEVMALRTAVENENTPNEELKAKLAALREFRRKASAELEILREDLRKVLTVRQEAALVSAGVLE